VGGTRQPFYENTRPVGFYRRLGWKDWKIEDGDRFMIKEVNTSLMDLTL
jgi:hypothetical protein